MIEINRYNYDDELIKSFKNGISYKAYQYPKKSIVLGRNSNLEDEVFIRNVEEDGVEVLRRASGGGTVFLDEGNIIVSIIGNFKYNNINELYNLFCGAIIDSLGNGAHRGGISDIVLENKKIGGSCLYLKKDLIYFSSSILVCANIDLMGRYLKHPPSEPDYRKNRNHFDFVYNINGNIVDIILKLNEGLKFLGVPKC